MKVTIKVTGPKGSGKSSVARKLERILRDAGATQTVYENEDGPYPDTVRAEFRDDRGPQLNAWSRQ